MEGNSSQKRRGGEVETVMPAKSTADSADRFCLASAAFLPPRRVVLRGGTSFLLLPSPSHFLIRFCVLLFSLCVLSLSLYQVLSLSLFCARILFHPFLCIFCVHFEKSYKQIKLLLTFMIYASRILNNIVMLKKI